MSLYIVRVAGHRIAGIKLDRILDRELVAPKPGDPRPYLASLVRRQIDLIRGLCDTEPAVFDLRYAVAPAAHASGPTPLSVALLWRAESDTQARAVGKHLLQLLRSGFPEYSFTPVQTAADFAVFRPRARHVADLTRRAGMLPLSSRPRNANRRLGFHATTTPESRRPQAFFVFPLVPTLSSLASIATTMTGLTAPTVISLRLEPTQLRHEESEAFLHLLHHLGDSTNPQRVVPPTHAAGPLADRRRAVAAAVATQFDRLTHAPLKFRVQLASTAPVPSALVAGLRTALTRGAAETPVEGAPRLLEHSIAPSLAGGLEQPRTDARQALADFRTLDCGVLTLADAPEGLERWPGLISPDEAVALFRLPLPEPGEFPGLSVLRSRVRLAPASVPTSGLLLGRSATLTHSRPVAISADDRRRHIYAVGQTGTGKSTFFESLALQDIREGRGLCLIDPHGQLAERLLQRIPQSRIDDVIYVDPHDTERPVGLNLLEWCNREERHFIADELASMLGQIAENPEFVGPMFFHYLRNFAHTVMSNPNQQGTLVDLVRLYTESDTRKSWVAHVDDPMVARFWKHEWEATTAYHRSDMMGYFISKFCPLISSPLMRNIVGQSRSTIDFDAVMRDGKILLVNLAKGRLGDQAARVIGMIIVARLASACMRRIDQPESGRPDFALYVDEFHNLATRSFATLLAEARKFRLSLVLTNQFVSQLGSAAWARHLHGAVQQSLLANVGTLVAFRCGVDDAELLRTTFGPALLPTDLMNLPNFRAAVSGLVSGAKTRPYTLDTEMDQAPLSPAVAAAVVARSREKYGTDCAVGAKDPEPPGQPDLKQVNARKLMARHAS